MKIFYEFGRPVPDSSTCPNEILDRIAWVDFYAIGPNAEPISSIRLFAHWPMETKEDEIWSYILTDSFDFRPWAPWVQYAELHTYEKIGRFCKLIPVSTDYLQNLPELAEEDADIIWQKLTKFML